MFLTKLFKNHILKNQRGSTLTITLAVIAVLSFSVVSVTKLTVNLSSSTTQHMQNANDEALGKALITKAINDMQIYITTEGSYDGFDTLVKPGIETELGVGIINSTASFDGFGDNSNVHSRIYKFTYLMSNGQTLFKYSYISAFGTTVNTPHPFSFSMGTDADIVLNGGNYNAVSMYGKNIYLSNMSAWQEDDLNPGPTNHVSNPYPYNMPDFSYWDGEAKIYYNEEYKYCTTDCIEATYDQSSPFVIRDDIYSDVDGSTYGDPGDVVPNNISQFFSSFILSDYALDYGLNQLPTRDMVIDDPTINIDNFAQKIVEYAGPASNGNGNTWNYYDDVTDFWKYDPLTRKTNFSKGALWQGEELIIRRDHSFNNDKESGMIVVGDMTIDNNQSNRTIKVNGTYIVTGDLKFTGYNVKFDNCTFIVLGSVLFDFDYGYGFETYGAYEDLSIIAGDNVIIKNMWETLSLTLLIPVTMMVYTDESIWIDAVESMINLQGALYAKGTGESENPIPMVNNDGDQVNGIVINSYQGLVLQSQSGSAKRITYIPVPDWLPFSNRFRLREIPENQFEDYFLNIPVLENVTVSESVFTVDLGEWQKE